MIDHYAYHEVFEANTYHVQPGELHGKTVFDIGANIGLFTQLAIEHGAKKVIAVEPQLTVYKRLASWVEPYPIVALNRAVTDKDGDIVKITDENTNSKLSDDGDPVVTVSLSTLIKEHGTDNTDILKMDIEGGEYAVLLSSLQELRHFQRIYIEIHPHDSYKYGTDMLFKVIKDSGYDHQWRFTMMVRNEKGEGVEKGVYTDKWIRRD